MTFLIDPDEEVTVELTPDDFELFPICDECRTAVFYSAEIYEWLTPDLVRCVTCAENLS